MMPLLGSQIDRSWQTLLVTKTLEEKKRLEIDFNFVAKKYVLYANRRLIIKKASEIAYPKPENSIVQA